MASSPQSLLQQDLRALAWWRESGLAAQAEATLADGRARRCEAQVARGPDRQAWLEVRRPKWIMGTFEEGRAQVQRFAEAGAERLMLQDMLPWDLDMIRDMGRELVAGFRAG